MIVDLDELERRAKQDGFLRQCSSVSHSTMLALIARLRAAEARAERLREGMTTVLNYVSDSSHLYQVAADSLAADDAARGDK